MDDNDFKQMYSDIKDINSKIGDIKETNVAIQKDLYYMKKMVDSHETKVTDVIVRVKTLEDKEANKKEIQDNTYRKFTYFTAFWVAAFTAINVLVVFFH